MPRAGATAAVGARIVAPGGEVSAALGGNASGNELGNGRPRHESFGAAFVLHAA